MSAHHDRPVLACRPTYVGLGRIVVPSGTCATAGAPHAACATIPDELGCTSLTHGRCPDCGALH